ncbi:HotDog domain-containing protein [Annulohypoxylon truncatum]|uniref:HotDog domain-containing protein n=1 Tax=Annulohypoxylon truncatum TaxID=327061 RepID=UPI002007C436|nr:HotDog domain-containing protein [Annulohypoxylon truncatum]KAI1214307.1 HotDog domain-containing protein [Annulohypoxylon truncatum]
MSESPKEKELPRSSCGLETTKSREGIERVKAFLESYKDSKNPDWMTNIIPYLSLVSYSSSPPHPSITFKFTVQPIHCNNLNTLHGGCASTILDSCTTLVLHLISKPGFWQYASVSRTVNVTYIRPIPVGTTTHVKCSILHAGRNLCSLRGEMRSVTEDGQEGLLLVVCEHGKANINPPAEKL